jgi:hypothetical protein
MTTGQINIWRAHVRQATHEAWRSHRPVSRLMTPTERMIETHQQVLCATFCAKIDGREFSLLQR